MSIVCASHGAPAMLTAQNAKDSIDNDIGTDTRHDQMGKLPYGTSYGSLVGKSMGKSIFYIPQVFYSY